jgi:hypothetical protein
MSRHDIDFVSLDLAGERELGLALHDPFPELGGHLLSEGRAGSASGRVAGRGWDPR